MKKSDCYQSNPDLIESADIISDFTIQQILDQNPDLLERGWRCSQPDEPLCITPQFVRQVRTGVAYLAEHHIPANIGSYDLKHYMEEWGRVNSLAPYVCNCAGIGAALLCGYRAVRTKHSGPNCHFLRARA